MAVTLPQLKNTVERAVSRAGRELNARVPYLHARGRRTREQLRAEHAPLLPKPTPAQAELLARLRADGAFTTTLANLGVSQTEQLQLVLENLRASLEIAPSAGRRVVFSGRDEVARDPVLWTWGLAHELLDLAEAYLGLPPIYWGAQVRREVADGKISSVRQWHRDVEDDRMFKILIWLNDVDLTGGPFEYVPKSTTEIVTERLSYVSGFVNEERFIRAGGQSQWRAATGPMWTALLTDTTAVFHRAKTPTTRDRYSVTYTYTTNAPRKTYPVEAFTPQERAAIHAGLTERQVRCLPPTVGRTSEQ